MRRSATIGALLLFFSVTSIHAQVIERPVPFDSAASVMVVTPLIASRAELRPPAWPVAGDFVAARLYTVTDSSYVLTVTRRTGVVERYTLSVSDRDAIRVSVSRLPREMLEERNDARNAFIRNQTLLGIIVYGPAFAVAVANNGAAATAGYLVVAGGSFFAASEISRRMFISRAQKDLSTNTGFNGALAGWATMYLLHAGEHGQGAGAFVGGLAGAALGLRFGRNMTEAEAVGAGFGSRVGALIAWGTTEAFQGEDRCSFPTAGGVPTCGNRLSDRGQVALILASGLIGYPLGLLYPRNSSYNVTPGDIHTLWTTAGLGTLAGISLLPESPKQGTAFAAATAGGVLGIIAGDRFLARRFDHSRTDAGLLTLGTTAGALMGAGVAALINNDFDNPQLVFGLATVGGLTGLIVTERYLDPRPDAGRRRRTLAFVPTSLALLAARTPGTHALFNMRF